MASKSAAHRKRMAEAMAQKKKEVSANLFWCPVVDVPPLSLHWPPAAPLTLSVWQTFTMQLNSAKTGKVLLALRLMRALWPS